MLECRQCGSNCDAADLRNGLCDECREKEKQRNISLISPVVILRQHAPKKNQRAG